MMLRGTVRLRIQSAAVVLSGAIAASVAKHAAVAAPYALAKICRGCRIPPPPEAILGKPGGGGSILRLKLKPTAGPGPTGILFGYLERMAKNK